jgi:hypothetical protein
MIPVVRTRLAAGSITKSRQRAKDAKVFSGRRHEN